MLPRSLQTLALGGALLSLAACSGSSQTPIAGVPGGGFGNSNSACDPGGAVSLANPPSGNINVQTNLGQVIIVTDSSSNSLARNPGQWNVILVDAGNSNNAIQGGTLNPVPFQNGPHPYTNDFYYASSIPQLSPGRNYTVYLNQNANCLPSQVGFFST